MVQNHMPRARSIVAVLVYLLLHRAPPSAALDNGVARKPPMGYNSWCVCTVSPCARCTHASPGAPGFTAAAAAECSQIPTRARSQLSAAAAVLPAQV